MKRIKAVNGYTIYQATARDAANRNVEEGYFYLFFSSDIRDYGLSNSDWDWEAGSIEEAEAFATGTNYAVAKEIVEETTTAASFEEIAEVEAKLDSGMTREEIEEESEVEKEIDTMTTMRFTEVQNTHGQTYHLTVRKHTDDFDKYGYPYSIKIENANPKAFDLNNHTFLYDDWQTAYKRLKELAEEYTTIKPLVIAGVDGETGLCI